MELFRLTHDKISNVALKPFQLEQEIQNLIEGNTEELFQLELIRSEFTVGKYRVDSLCFDPETGGFVIIEYKKGNSYSVIDQGYTYLQLLLNNKSDFILALSQKRNKIFRQEDIDWSQSRIIFISPGFNSYQRDSVNFKNVPFELYEIKRFENECFLLNKIETTSKERIDSLSNTQANSVIRDVSKEVTVIDEENHVSKMSEAFSKKWEQLREQLLEMEDVELEAKKQYITAKVNNKAIAYFNFRRNSITINVHRGNLNLDGTPSRNFFTLDDPKNLSKERSWEWKSGVKGNVYDIPYTQNTDLNYVMFLLKQKYKSVQENSN